MKNRAEIITPMLVLRDEGFLEDEIQAYIEAHPRTYIVILYHKDCGEGSTG